MRRRDLLDRLNTAFFEYMSRTPKNIRRVRELNRKIIENRGQNITGLILNSDIDIEPYLVLGAVQAIINDMKNDMLIPLTLFVGMYSLNRPEAFAKKTVHILNGYDLNNREKQARKYIKAFTNRTPPTLDRRVQNNLKRIEIRNKNAMFRDVEFDKLDEDTLMRKYNDKQRVQRALVTEMHEQAESTKTEQAKAFGVTHKVWITQRDKRVRDTAWHNSVDGMKVLIDDDFRAVGMTASHPGDIRLPVGERINCRCYLEFE